MKAPKVDFDFVAHMGMSQRTIKAGMTVYVLMPGAGWVQVGTCMHLHAVDLLPICTDSVLGGLAFLSIGTRPSIMGIKGRIVMGYSCSIVM